MRVFISYVEEDEQIATALEVMLKEVFRDKIEVARFSTGIAVGANWRQWILEQVETSKHALVVITPNSIDHPWPMWESGAVTGVALHSKEAAPVIPIVFGLDATQLPPPLAELEVAAGDQESGMKHVIERLNESLVAEDSLDSKSLDRYFKHPFEEYYDAIDVPPPGIHLEPLQSVHAVAWMHIDLGFGRDHKEKALFTASSNLADEMFHYPIDADRSQLAGVPIYRAFDKLEPYTDSVQWEYLQKEQAELQGYLLMGNPRPATIPLVFLEGDAAEEKNVNEKFRGKAYLPLIVQQTSDEQQHSLKLRVLYQQVPIKTLRQQDHVVCEIGSIHDSGKSGNGDERASESARDEQLAAQHE